MVFLQIQYLTSMSLELHTHTRGSLKPDPELDPVLAVFYFIHHDWPRPDGSPGENTRLGIIAIDIDHSGFTSFVGVPVKTEATPTKGNAATPTKGSMTKENAATPTKGGAATPIKPSDLQDVSPAKVLSSHVQAGTCTHGRSSRRSRDPDGYLSRCGLPCHVEVKYVSCEHELLQCLVRLVREEDPDFMIGYEVVMASWGYLIERAAALDVNLVNQLSRIPSECFTGVT